MLYEISEKAQKEVIKYCDDYEIYVEQGKTLSIDSKRNELSFAEESISLGFGIRVIKDKKLGFAFTSNINKICDTVKQAVENTKLNEADENYNFSNKSKVKNIKGLYDSKVESLELEESCDFLKTMIEIVEDEKCEVTSGGFQAGKGESLIINSNDVSIYKKGTSFGAGIAVNAIKDDKLSTAYDSKSSRYFDIDGEKISKDVCKLAKDSINGEKIETQDFDVILDYHAARGLLSTFLSSFSSDNVQRGRSILADKINEEIANPDLSIINDSTLEKGLLSSDADGEGTPSKKTVLVKDGVLKSFLYNIYTANKENKESTSNGYRSSFTSTPSLSPSNIIFDFKNSISIEEINKGFITTDVLGAHTANPISGDFSVEANNAFLIENGEIKTPVKKAMISGNIFNLIKNCEKLESETKQNGAFIIPKILMHNVRVVG